MTNADYDPKKFKKDSHGNLIRRKKKAKSKAKPMTDEEVHDFFYGRLPD